MERRFSWFAPGALTPVDRWIRGPVTVLMLPFLLAVAQVDAAAAAPVARSGDGPEAEELLCDGSEARKFDFWIGEWDVLNRNRREESANWFATGRATDRVYPVVGGCAFVEHWRGEAFGNFFLGYSVRAFDRETGRWKLVLLWPQPGRTRFGVRYGGFRHGRGTFSRELPGPDGEPVLSRFVFSDIGPDSLRWESERSIDGGRSWSGRWIMEFSRRDRIRDGGLWNGATAGTHRCPAEAHRAFDRFVGEWRGVRRSPDTRGKGSGEGVAVRARIAPILDGCAIMDRVWSEGQDPWEVYRVRAWETEAERWVEYRIGSDRRDLHRREAERTDSGWRFTEIPDDPVEADGTAARGEREGEPADAASGEGTRSEPTSVRDRTIWRLGEEEGPVLVEQRSTDGGDTWIELYRIELVERRGRAEGAGEAGR